jgi:predicted acyltransferase
MNQLVMPSTLTSNGLLKQKTSMRYLSLDVLRGMTVALMIVVNTPGSWGNIYAPFQHAAWHGFTPTDLVFPTFLFVVGNAMSFSMKKFEKQENQVFLKKVLTRTALIFFIGLLLTYFPLVFRSAEGGLILKDPGSIRIMGVLQRIALCYFIAALVLRYLKIKGALIFSIFSLLGYWAVMHFFGEQPNRYSLEHNAALKFDLLLFPVDNLYKGFGIPFDPEGLLSTWPAVVNVIAGYFTGLFIRKNGNSPNTLLRLLFAGTTLTLLALLWNLYFPINKPIWTSSYVLCSTGLVLLLLPVLMFVLEIVKLKKWAYFFEVFGKNPLFIYVLAGLIIKTMHIINIDGSSLNGWIYQRFFLSWSEGKNASLLFAIAYLLLLWGIAYWMDKKKIYVKV